ncbi:twin-arginine translocation signal domain-containing protein [uncultured Polaribacter sp.]|nr:twin-arginine translocation signal domain-containing protein [uncultured Polaribacter sp.]
MKRRNFIKKAGIAGAGILSSSSLFGAMSKVNNSNSIVNIGIIEAS